MSALYVLRKSVKSIICKEVVFFNNFFTKGWGLTFHRRIYDKAYVFPFSKSKKIAVTMWFVFFPIDLLFLDEKQKVVEIKKNFRPFTNYFPERESMYIVELPAGTVDRKKIKEKEKIIF